MSEEQQEEQNADAGDQPEAGGQADPGTSGAPDGGGAGDSAGGSDSDGDPRDELDSGEPGEVGDDMLPEDLQPTSDNPLARHPGQTGDDEDLIGAGGDEERARNPSASMSYGSAGSDSDDEGDEGDSGSEDSEQE